MEFHHSTSDAEGAGSPAASPRRLAALMAAMAVLVLAAAGAAVAWTAESPAGPAPPPPLPVQVVAADFQDGYARTRTYPGRIAAARRSALGFERDGLLIQVAVDDGDAVAAGDILAVLDTEPLQRRRAELAAARRATLARLALAEATLRRRSTLVDRGHASDQALDEARFEVQALTAEAERLAALIAAIDLDIDKSALRAPFAGRVDARLADEGTVVEPGQPVLRLVETGRLEARIGVPEAAARALDPGEPYAVEILGAPVDATLRALTPALDPTTRTVTAVFDLDPQGTVDPAVGALVRLRLPETVPEPGVWLPRTALTEGVRGLWTVFTLDDADDGAGTVRRADVEILHAEAARVYVRGTLAPGDLVVADGTHRVVPGQRVVPAAGLVADVRP
jgi:RND family efflux transporter MFP subunit